MASNDDLMELLKKIAVEQDFQNPEIVVTPVSSGGANYSSKLYQARIAAAGRELHLFVKVAALTQQMMDTTPLQPFDNEVVFYTELLEAYKRLEETHGVLADLRLRTPTFYSAAGERGREVLVLSDVTTRGFHAHDRLRPVSWPYAVAAVTELAKLHALSLAYRHYQPTAFNNTLSKFKSGMFTENDDSTKFFSESAKAALKAVREENRARLKCFLDKRDIMTYCEYFQPVRRTVLVHVDYRPSNMLHVDRDDGSVELVPVDFQTIQGGSPVVDLLYFIFCSTDGQFRSQYYRRLVDLYHAELTAALLRLGLDVDQHYSKEDFEFEMKENLPFGLLVSILLLPVVLVSEHHAPSLDDGITMANMVVEATSPLYVNRLNEVVDDFITWGIL